MPAFAGIDPPLRPVAAIGFAIFRAVRQCADGLRPTIDELAEDKRKLREIYTTNEFIFFFLHVSRRQASAHLPPDQCEHLSEYLVPLVCDTAVDSYFEHWPPESEEGLRRTFREDVRLSELDYQECDQFNPETPIQRRGDAILVGLLEMGSLRLLAQLGYGANPLYRDRISKIMHEVYKNFDVRRSLEQFKRVGMKLPPGSKIFPQ